MKPIYEIDKQANNENESNAATVNDGSAGQEKKIEIDVKLDVKADS